MKRLIVGLLLVLSFVLAAVFAQEPMQFAPFMRPNVYLAANAVFTRTNSQYMKVSADFSDNGIANSTNFTVSCWIKRNSENTNSLVMSFATSGGADRFFFGIDPNNVVQAGGYSSGNVLIFHMVGSNVINIASGWTHIYVAANLANAAQVKIYVNGVLDATNTIARINNAIQFEGLNYQYWIGAYEGADLFWNGAISELWWNDTYFDDPSKFIVNGCPVSLGSDGSTPTGSQPAFYFRGSGNAFNVSSGSAGTGGEVFGITNGPLTTTVPKCF